MNGYILLVYEDAKFDGLDKIIRQARRALHASDCPLERVTVGGTGGFRRDIGRLAAVPMIAKRRTSPDFVVCVADGDRPSNLVDDFSGDMRKSADLHRFRREWRRKLQGEIKTLEHRERVFCEVIRWSQESLVISAIEALHDWAGPSRAADLMNFFGRCKPDPTSLAQ